MIRRLARTSAVVFALFARTALAQDASPAPPAPADPPASSPAEAPQPPPPMDTAAPSPAAEPNGVGAQEPKPAKEEVPEVRVIGDKADALPKVPGSGTVVGAKDIKRAQPIETAEMLRRVPGVQAREDYGGGGRLDISVRGLDAGRSRRVLLLEDGMPLALNPYSEPDMYFAPAIERYRSIEVVKGSGNILFGPQTLAGTINFVTLAPPERQSVALDVDAGTYGYTRALGRYGDTAGDARYVVQLLHRRGDGFRALPFDSTNGLAKIVFPTGENGTATLKLGFHRDDAASDDVGLTSAMYARTPRRGSLSPRSHLELQRYDVGLTHEHRFSSAVSLKTLAYAYRTTRVWRRQDYSRTPVNGEIYERIVGDVGTPGGAIYFKPSNIVLDRTYDVAGLEPRLQIKARTGDLRHTLDVGARGLVEFADYAQRSGGYPETYAGALDTAETRKGLGVAGYVQDRIAFTDRLLVTPGVRVERFSYRQVLLRAFQNGAPTDMYLPFENDGTSFVPGIGLVYGTRAAHGFFGLHRGFAPPRSSTSVSARGATTRVGADESTSAELGTRVAPVKSLKLEAAGFTSVFQNQVIANTAPGADVSLVDAGATLIRGVESAASVDLARAFHWETAVEIGARYTYSRATFRYGPDAGRLLPYAPEHSANANLDVEHPFGIGGQVAYTFVGPQFSDTRNTVAEDVTGRVGQIDPWHIVNATLHYAHKPSGLTFRLTVKNALDTPYIAARRPEGIQPAGFRLVMLGVRWEWEKKAPATAE